MKNVGYPASLARRLGAMLYDALLLLALWMVSLLLIVIANSGEAVSGPLVQGLLLAETFAFYGWSWRKQGHTLGMLAWRIHVTDADGQRPSWGQITIRLLVAVLSFACIGAGYVWMLFDKEGKTWHDKASNTQVVHTPKEE